MSVNGLVDVFPISTSAFGFHSDWFEKYAPRLVQPTYLLMVLMLVVAIGIMVLKRFENANLEKKVWNLPVIITLVGVWPLLIVEIKDLVDTFNTFLIADIFRIPWKGFGFPEISSVTNIVGWSAEGLARLLPNLSYWLIYAFYIVFFFFYAVLGPFVLAKGILFDEIDTFLELVKEIILLFLWQTTLVILVAFIMPEIVSGKPFPAHPRANFYFLSLILGIMILFVPSVTRKFANHLGSSIFPPGFRWAGTMLGLSAAGKVASAGLSSVGVHVSPHRLSVWRHRVLASKEFTKRYRHQHELVNMEYEDKELKRRLHQYEAQFSQYAENSSLAEEGSRFPADKSLEGSLGSEVNVTSIQKGSGRISSARNDMASTPLWSYFQNQSWRGGARSGMGGAENPRMQLNNRFVGLAKKAKKEIKSDKGLEGDEE